MIQHPPLPETHTFNLRDSIRYTLPDKYAGKTKKSKSFSSLQAEHIKFYIKFRRTPRINSVVGKKFVLPATSPQICSCLQIKQLSHLAFDYISRHSFVKFPLFSRVTSTPLPNSTSSRKIFRLHRKVAFFHRFRASNRQQFYLPIRWHRFSNFYQVSRSGIVFV